MLLTKVLIEEQCGFRKGRGCDNQIFTLRLRIEKSLEFLNTFGPQFCRLRASVQFCLIKEL